MSNGIDTASDVPLASLLTFTWGQTPNIARYTSWANGLILNGQVFAAEPKIEVTSGKQPGGATDQAFTVRMPVLPPLDTLTSQRTHAVVRVDIEEIDPADASTRRKLFAGTIMSSIRNKEGKTGIVEAQVAGWRQALDRPLQSWVAGTHCQNTFGDGVCQKDLTALRELAVISAIDGTTLTLSGLSTTTVDGYWRFGYVNFDGLSISVREYTTGAALQLMQIPPPAWLGQLVMLTPGCDGTLANCRDRWANEGRFTGGGLKIPAYHPLMEST